MSFPPYERYRHSEIEWLDELPGHWKDAPLGSVTRLIQTGPFGSQLHADDYVVDGVPVINPSHIEDGRLVADSNCTVTEDTCGRLAQYRISEHDIIFARRGEMGRCAVASLDNVGWLCGTGSMIVRMSESVFPPFAAAYFRTTRVRELLRLSSVGSTMDNLNETILSRVRLPLPPLSEQMIIARFLELETAKIGALVYEQTRLIELLNEKRQAVISHAVTKGLDPNAPMKESCVDWLGGIPAHWEVTRLKFLADVQGGVAKGRDLTDSDTIEVPNLRVANVQDGYLDLDEISRITIAKEELSRYSLRPGDVLMNEGGDFDKLGRGHIWRGEIEMCIHQNHVFAVRPKHIEAEWLNLLTSAACGRFYFMSRSKQGTNLASISSTNIKEFRVPCAPVAERRCIIEYVDVESARVDALTVEAKAAITLLQERRSALISAAVTGKIDVRGLVSPKAEAA
jgi:type I restriction enzyme, S subunit